jgi:hypothetical protein
MVHDQDCKMGAARVQYGFQSNVQWPLKSGLNSYPSEVIVDEYVEFYPRKPFRNHRCQDMTHEVLRIQTALRSHPINNMKAVSSPNNSEYKFCCADLLSHSF